MGATPRQNAQRVRDGGASREARRRDIAPCRNGVRRGSEKGASAGLGMAFPMDSTVFPGRARGSGIMRALEFRLAATFIRGFRVSVGISGVGATGRRFIKAFIAAHSFGARVIGKSGGVGFPRRGGGFAIECGMGETPRAKRSGVDFLQERHFLVGQITGHSGLQIGREFKGIDGDARKGFDAEADLGAHLADLAVSSFTEDEMETMTRTEIAIVKALDVFDANGLGLIAVFQHHGFLELPESRFVEDAADLNGVEFGMTVARMGQAVDKGAIGREDEETVGIAVEASGGDESFGELAQAGKDGFSVGFVGGAE